MLNKFFKKALCDLPKNLCYSLKANHLVEMVPPLFVVVFIFAFNICSGQKNSPNVKLPVVKWKFHSSQPFISSPVIDHNIIYIGGLDSILYALDPKGKIIWNFRTSGPIRSAVTIKNNSLVFSGGDGFIYCLDKLTGKKVWIFRTLGGILGERRYDAADYFDSQPIISGDHVYVGSGDGKLYAIDLLTGKIVWYFKADDIIHTTPVLASNKIIFGSSDGNLYSLNIGDGSLHWKFKAIGHRNFSRGEMQGSPAASGGLAFIGSRDYNLYAIDLQGGYGHWNKQFQLGWATAITATDSVLYVGTSDDKLFIAMDPLTGKELWKIDVRFNIFGPATVFKTNVYVGTQMGKVFEIDKRTGIVNWIFTTDGYQSNRLKYFKTDDTFRDDIYSLIKGFDSYLKMLYSLGAVYSSPAITDNTIVFSSSEGIVYCLSR